jgi:hypothetical protein
MLFHIFCFKCLLGAVLNYLHNVASMDQIVLGNLFILQ